MDKGLVKAFVELDGRVGFDLCEVDADEVFMVLYEHCVDAYHFGTRWFMVVILIHDQVDDGLVVLDRVVATWQLWSRFVRDGLQLLGREQVA